MAFEEPFPIPSESAIASYDFVDIAEATGKINYSLYITNQSTGKENILGTEDVYSENIEIKNVAVTATVNTDTKIFDEDFDLSPMNLPRTIRGESILEISWIIQKVSGIGTLDSAFLIAKIRKWDGSTETEIASTQTIDIGSFNSVRSDIISITIPSTLIKKGEQLRLTIEGWVNQNDEFATFELTIGTDPKNRDGTLIVPSGDATGKKRTKTPISIPYRIDL